MFMYVPYSSHDHSYYWIWRRLLHIKTSSTLRSFGILLVSKHRPVKYCSANVDSFHILSSICVFSNIGQRHSPEGWYKIESWNACNPMHVFNRWTMSWLPSTTFQSRHSFKIKLWFKNFKAHSQRAQNFVVEKNTKTTCSDLSNDSGRGLISCPRCQSLRRLSSGFFGQPTKTKGPMAVARWVVLSVITRSFWGGFFY